MPNFLWPFCKYVNANTRKLKFGTVPHVGGRLGQSCCWAVDAAVQSHLRLLQSEHSASHAIPGAELCIYVCVCVWGGGGGGGGG